MNFVIAGGGTAGWLAALFLVKAHPNKHKVTLIESSQIGIIGAGEGSTGVMYDLLSNSWFDTGTTIPEFLKAVDGTPKMGIRHKNWTPKGDSYYAPLDGSRTSGANPDIDFLRTFAKQGYQGMHKASPMGKTFENGMISPNASFHFNAHKIGPFFKKLLSDSVTVIDAKIDQVQIDEHAHISELWLDNGQKVSADFFIDCTGMGRKLISKLQVDWKTYHRNLPVNKAMPFILPYEEGVKVEPVTVAHALNAGWMWQIPTSERIGCGYVFDSHYITPDQAQEEVETLLGKKIEPIKILDFQAGRSNRLWEGNCLALGLAAAFAEPLEATSIHTTIIQLLNFTFEYLTDDINQTVNENNRQLYNRKMTKMYDDILDFLVIHYQGGRTDTEFWQRITQGETLTSFAAEVLEKCKHKIPGVLNYDYYYGCVGSPLWNWVLAGIGRITPDQAKQELANYNVLL
jgi:hypothetical protein